jgi:hypothetical protein
MLHFLPDKRSSAVDVLSFCLSFAFSLCYNMPAMEDRRGKLFFCCRHYSYFWVLLNKMALCLLPITPR